MCTLMGSFWTKYIMFWLKKVQRSTRHWRVIKNLKKNWLVVWKNNMRNLANFYQTTWNSQNWDFDGILSSKVENVSVKLTEELCIMAVNNDVKFEEELTSRFKIDIRNLMNFDPSIWMSQEYSLWWAPLTKVYNIWATKVHKSYV